MLNSIKKYSCVIMLLVISLVSSSCVESLSESSSNASVTPNIVIYSPVSNDTIKVGSNPINYAATDGSGGTGLDHIDFYLNGIYQQSSAVNSDGGLPTVTITVDSTMVGKKISYYLIVYNKQSKSKASSTQSNIYIKDKAPNAPSNLLASFTGTTAITLIWNDNSNNEEGFEIYRRDLTSTDVKDSHLITRVTKGINKSKSYVDNTVTSTGTYYYKVRAYNYKSTTSTSGYQYSNFSEEVKAYNSNNIGSWNLRAESITDPSIHLYWNDFVPTEIGFIITRNPSFSDGSSTILLAPNTTEYVDKDVSPNSNYSYQIAFQLKDDYRSPYSSSVSTSTYYTTVTAPTLVQILTPINSSQSGFHLQWKEQSKTTMSGTIIQRMQLLPFVDWQDVDNMPISDIETDIYDDTKATVGRGYQYRIRQYATNGSSMYYTPWLITPQTTAK